MATTKTSVAPPISSIGANKGWSTTTDLHSLDDVQLVQKRQKRVPIAQLIRKKLKGKKMSAQDKIFQKFSAHEPAVTPADLPKPSFNPATAYTAEVYGVEVGARPNIVDPLCKSFI